MDLQPDLRGLPVGPNSSNALGTLPRALLDEIECGLLVCNGQSDIQFANQAAQRELAMGGLLVRRGDQLQRAIGATGELDEALRLAAQRGRRSLLRLCRGNDRLLATVLPLRQATGEAPLLLVMLGRRQPCTDLGLEMLASSHGLTLAERRVLGALVREATPREIANAHAVALSTVRTQISSIRSKMGARNVEGLLLRAAEVPPVASALRLAIGALQPSGSPPWLAAA